MSEVSIKSKVESQMDVAKDAMLLVLTTMSAEQFAQVAQALVVTRDNAIVRQCGQAVEIEFNDKGYPRYIHYRQSVKTVRAE